MSPGRQQFQMDDYIDVAARIAEFRSKHPAGSLQQKSLEFREVNGGWWVIYTAAAYRDAEDTRPGEGTAWEPIPGRTPYTRDSEVQNAETAAWGRAIVAALASDTKKGVASADEVRNRQADREAVAKPPTVDELIAAAQTAGSNDELSRIARTAVAVLQPGDLADLKAIVTARREELKAAS